MKTDSGYPRNAEFTLFTIANPESSLRFKTHWSAPPVSALARSSGPSFVFCFHEINFGTTFPTHFSKSEFKNEISSSALLDIQMTLLCVCGVDSFIPELEHWIENPFHGFFFIKKSLKSDPWIQIQEMKLRSTSSADKNFLYEIAWIT